MGLSLLILWHHQYEDNNYVAQTNHNAAVPQHTSNIFFNFDVLCFKSEVQPIISRLHLADGENIWHQPLEIDLGIEKCVVAILCFLQKLIYSLTLWESSVHDDHIYPSCFMCVH